MLGNYSIYLSLSGANVVISYIFLLYIVNTMSKFDYAKFGLFTSITGILLIFLNFGHREVLFKLSSQQDERRLLNVKMSGLALSSIVLATSFILLIFQNYLLSLAMLAMVTFHLLTLHCAEIRGRGEYMKDASVMPLYRTIWLTMVVIFSLGTGYLVPEMVFASAAISAVILLVAFGQISTGNPVGNLRAIMRDIELKLFGRFIAIELVMMGIKRSDMLLLTGFKIESEKVAEYFFSSQILESVILIIAPISYLFFNKYNKLPEGAFNGVKLCFSSLLLLGGFVLALWSGWHWLGGYLLTTFFPAYTSAAEIISLHLLSTLPHGLSLIFSYLLIAHSKEIFYVIAGTLGLIIMMLFNIYMIPVFGTSGAAIGRFMAECTVTIVLMLSTWFLISKKAL